MRWRILLETVCNLKSFHYWQVAWAPPKTISEDKQLKEFWELKDGAAYIPWGQLPSDLNPITESEEAFLDESTLPGSLTKPKLAESQPQTGEPMFGNNCS